MLEQVKAGEQSPALATATDKIAAILAIEHRVFDNERDHSTKNSAVRMIIRQVIDLRPADALEVLTKLQELYSQRALEESLLTELQTKS
jgi:hypothetical protein